MGRSSARLCRAEVPIATVKEGRTMTQSTESTEDHNASKWPMELKELGFKLAEHIDREGNELDMWRSEITQTESKLEELQREVTHLEYKLRWLKKCWYIAHKLGLIMERHGEVILKDDPNIFDDFVDSWGQPEGSKERK